MSDGQAPNRATLRQALPNIGLLSVAIAITVLMLALIEPRFLSSQNLRNLLRAASLLMIVSIAQMQVLIVRGFDLSVGAVMALVSVASASVMVSLSTSLAPQWVTPLGIAAGLGAGLLAGLINGLCVAVLRITPFMVTLATASILTGLTLLLTNGIPIYGLPASFITLGRGSWLGLPAAVYTALFVVGVAAWVQRHTAIGVHLYAVGGNPHAARASGVALIRCQIVAYAASGFLAALAALLLTAQLGSGQGSLGAGIALQSIGAAVIAGVSLHGGVGQAHKVALGALLMLLINNAMDLLRIDSKAQTIAMGLLLVFIVAMDTAGKKRRAL